MKKIEVDVVIIGAGLTGLSLAYYLRYQNLKVILVEGRDRLGGRILTLKEEGNAPLEMGATWIHDHHHASLDLLKELGVEVFEQEFGNAAIYEIRADAQAQLVSMPPSAPTYRIVGGSSEVIDGLVSNISREIIFLNQEVVAIREKADAVSVVTEDHLFEGKIVVSTLPPYLLASILKVEPALPAELIEAALHTRTWMGDSIKVALTYEQRFWKTETIAGTIFSKVGPVFEMYDHSDSTESVFAIKGFINGAYANISKADRCEMVVSQLEKFYGSQVRNFVTYEDLAWSNEKYTSAEMKDLLEPRSNFGHLAFQKKYLNGRLILAGTETSRREGGFMEGAVLSAKTIATKIQHEL